MIGFLPSTITVNSYPPISAIAVWVHSQEVLRIAGDERDARQALLQHPLYRRWVPLEPTSVVSWRLLHTRCQRCQHWRESAQFTDGRLGFVSYCDGCVDELAAACVQRHRRLPVRGKEFLCPQCVRIVLMDELCTQEENGMRKRWRCKPCRNFAFRRNWQKYRAMS